MNWSSQKFLFTDKKISDNKLYETLFAFDNGLNTLFNTSQAVIVYQDTRLSRLSNSTYSPNKVGVGSIFVEIDTGLLYINQSIQSVNYWVYRAGTYTLTQSMISTFKSSLGVYDKNLAIYVSNFDHTLVWSGTAFNFINGDRSAYIQSFYNSPMPAVGWHICDGSLAISYLTSTGSIALVNLPDCTGTDDVYLVYLTGASGTVIAQDTIPVDLGAGTMVASGTGATVASHTHTHPNVSSKLPNLKRLELLPYFRL